MLFSGAKLLIFYQTAIYIFLFLRQQIAIATHKPFLVNKPKYAVTHTERAVTAENFAVTIFFFYTAITEFYTAKTFVNTANSHLFAIANNFFYLY